MDSDEKLSGVTRDRERLNALRNLRDSIVADIKTLRKMERRETLSAAKYHSVTRTLRRAELPPDYHKRIEELRTVIYEKQRQFLSAQADLETEISAVQDHYVRLAMSLCYVDLLTHKEAAAAIGIGVTEGAIQRLIERYFRKRDRL